MQGIVESDLYEPVKTYLQGLGYEVKGEVKDCDITAVKEDELIVVELKRGFTLGLIYQALRRQAVADSVYVAVPLPKRGYLAPHYRDALSLCKRLELGLIFVGFTMNGKAQIDVAVHPKEARPPRKNAKKRMAILTEHAGRTGSQNVGGVSRRKIMTVYKEQALAIAHILHCQGPMKAEEVRKAGGPENTSRILGRNFYHWYEKCGDGGGRSITYQVTAKGLEALAEHADLLE